MFFCKICIMPRSRPRVVFNDEGICNACVNAQNKKLINWDERRIEFEEIVKNIKNNKKSIYVNSDYDCIVPWSGGKDSSYIAHRLKFEFKLNPLLVTFSPLLINDIGVYNREQLILEGFDNFYIRPNQKIARKLANRFFIERGNPKVAWDAGIATTPVKVALYLKIPYVFYAEHGESEYGGIVLNKNSNKIRDENEVLENLVGDQPSNWSDQDISQRELTFYTYPTKNDFKNFPVTSYYFSYFFRWSMLENYEYIKKALPKFRVDKNNRTEGTFTNFDSLDDKIDTLYYYMQYIKFGFGRATRDSCRMIQNDQMTRNEAIKLSKLYDHEIPKQNFEEILEYLNISKLDFDELVNKHRNLEIWKRKNNSWELINQL